MNVFQVSESGLLTSAVVGVFPVDIQFMTSSNAGLPTARHGWQIVILFFKYLKYLRMH